MMSLERINAGIRLLLAAMLLFLLPLTQAVAASTIEAEFTLQKKERVNRTTFDYFYKAKLKTDGQAIQSATATVTSTSADTVVVDGTVSFGAAAASAVVDSSDTFTIRQNRSTVFDPDVLVWVVDVVTATTTTTTLKTDTIMVDATSAPQIVDTTATNDDRTKIGITGDLVNQVSVGKVFHVLAGVDPRFPFGVSGSIDDVTTSAGATSIVLSPITYADVVEQSSSATKEIPLNNDNFIGVITPGAVTSPTGAAAQRSVRAVGAALPVYSMAALLV